MMVPLIIASMCKVSSMCKLHIEHKEDMYCVIQHPLIFNNYVLPIIIHEYRATGAVVALSSAPHLLL